MRILKFVLLAIAVLVLAVLGFAYFERERLALELANRILAGSAFEVSELSISSFRTDGLYLSTLVVRQSDGTLYELRDVEVPLDLPDTTITSANIGSIGVVPGTSSSEPFAVTPLVDTVLSLPASYPGLDIRVGQIDYPGLPPVSDLHWQSREDSQTASLLLDGVAVDVSTAPGESGTSEVRVGVARDSEILGSATLTLEPRDPGYFIEGLTRFDTGFLIADLQQRGLLTDAGVIVEGPLAGNTACHVETEFPGTFACEFDPTVESALKVAWKDAANGMAATIEEFRLHKLAVSYPELGWSVSAASFTADLEMPYWSSAELAVEKLDCSSDRGCDASARFRARRLSSAGVRAAYASANAEASLVLEPATNTPSVRLALSKLSANDVTGDGWSVAGFKTDAPKNLVVSWNPESLGATATEMPLAIENLVVGSELEATMPLTLADVRADLEAGNYDADFAIPGSGSTWQFGEVVPVSPDVNGRLRVTPGRIGADVEISNPAQGLAASVEIVQVDGDVAININSASTDFGLSPASKRVRHWPYEWDILSGSAQFEGNIAILSKGETTAYDGDLAIRLEDIAGNMNDIGATGVRGTIPVELRPDFSPRFGPADVSIAFIDVGMPVRDLAVRFDWDTASEFALIDGLEMKALGGSASARPFRVDVANMDAKIDLAVKDIQLALIAELASLNSVEVTGSLNGMIPITVNNSEVTVTDGRLESLAPGGEIRYQAGAPGDQASGLGFATRALSNLQYETLTSGVSYSEAGDLVLAMRLKGINPDIDPLQPVILNVNVENNIPQLLRSLQATRDIEDVIESRAD